MYDQRKALLHVFFLVVLILSGTLDSHAQIVEGEVLIRFSGDGPEWNPGKATYRGNGEIEKAASRHGLIEARMITEKSGKGAIARTIHHLRFPADSDAEQIAKELEGVPGVDHAEPVLRGRAAYVPSDPLWGQQLADLAAVGLEEAWEVRRADGAVRVAVLDSGVEAFHPDLVGALDLSASRNIADGTTSIYDDLGHGTRVAGLVGAAGNNGEGIAGVGFGATLISYDVFRSDGSVTSADVIAGLDQAAAAGAQVATLSFTFQAYSQLMDEACGAAEQAGLLLVGAAGNQNQGELPVYPASFDSVMGVGATGEDGTSRAPWSNFNGSEDGLVEVAAPGTTVLTTTPGESYGEEGSSGTSYSVAVVAGVAALLKAEYPGQSGAALRHHLRETAFPLGNWAGNGRIDAAEALGTPMVPEVVVASIDVDDDPAYSGNNDGDGVADVGERFRVSVELKSNQASVRDVTAVLSSASPNISEIQNQEAAYSLIEHGRPAASDGGPFGPLVVAADAPAGKIPFSLALSNDSGFSETVGFDLETESLFTAPRVIDTDMTWTSDKTWVIEEGTVVLEGATLTIEPGTTVRFAETAERDNKLEVRGGIECVGTEEERIRFEALSVSNSNVLQSSRDLNTGADPFGVTICDLDGNDLNDIIVTTLSEQRVWFHMQNTDGGFDVENTVNIPGSGLAGHVEAADLDNDGAIEIAVVVWGENVFIYQWTGNGLIGPEELLENGGYTRGVEVGDANNDGSLDILVPTWDDSTDTGYFLVFQWDGHSYHVVEMLPITTQITGSVIGDLDGDGDYDIVGAGVFNSKIEVHKWNDGGYDENYSVIPPYSPFYIDLDDLDGDNTGDIVVSNFSGPLSIYYGEDALQEGRSVDISTAEEYYDVHVEDLDHDTFPEILAVHLQDNQVTFIPNKNGQLGFPEMLTTGPSPRRIAVGDLSNNGLKDVAVTNGSHDTISIFEWKTNQTVYNNYGGLWIRPGTTKADFEYTSVSHGRILDESTVGSFKDVTVDRSGGDYSLSSELGTDALERCTVTGNDGGDGIRAGSKRLVDCVADGNGGTGLQGGELVNCVARDNGAEGMVGASASNCVAEENGGTGIDVEGDVVESRASGNGEWGIRSLAEVSASTASENQMGISAAVIDQCISARNAGIGLESTSATYSSRSSDNGGAGFSGADVFDSILRRNGEPLQLQSRAFRNYISENQGGATIEGGEIVSNVLLYNAGIGLKDTANVDNTWVLGNQGDGMVGIGDVSNSWIEKNSGRGIVYQGENLTVTSSAIIGNAGNGVENAATVSGSSLDGNGEYDYKTTVPSTQMVNVDVSGNYWGEETTEFMNSHPFGVGTTGDVPAIYDFYDDLSLARADYSGHLQSPADVGPDSRAPAFLYAVNTDGGEPLNSGEAPFILTFSEEMDQTVQPAVTFGPFAPYSENVIEPDPGWIDASTWQGGYTIDDQTGDTEHTLLVSGARSADGFTIPEDRAHSFTVDTSGSGSANNGILGSIGTTESKTSGPVGYVYFGVDGEAVDGQALDAFEVIRVYRWSLGNPLVTRIAEIPVPGSSPCADCGQLDAASCMLVLDEYIGEAGYEEGDLVYYQVRVSPDCGEENEVIWTAPTIVPAVYLPNEPISLPDCEPASAPLLKASVDSAIPSVPSGQTRDFTLTLRNEGRSRTAWFLSSDVDWLVPSLDADSLGGGSQIALEVTIDASGLPSSQTPYSGTLNIQGDGCLGVTVPVEVLVTEGQAGSPEQWLIH